MKEERVGDVTPSQLLRWLRDLSDSSFEDRPLLQKQFFSRIPTLAQSILAQTTVSRSMDQIVPMADKKIEFSVIQTIQKIVAGSLVASASQQFSLPNYSDLMSKIVSFS